MDMHVQNTSPQAPSDMPTQDRVLPLALPLRPADRSPRIPKVMATIPSGPSTTLAIPATNAAIGIFPAGTSDGADCVDSMAYAASMTVY